MDRALPPLVKPKHLKRGDTIGIVAPSSPPFESGHMEFVFQWLRDLGLKYKVGRHVFDSYSDYAGSDSARLDDLHSAFSDPEIQAVMVSAEATARCVFCHNLTSSSSRRIRKFL